VVKSEKTAGGTTYHLGGKGRGMGERHVVIERKNFLRIRGRGGLRSMREKHCIKDTLSSSGLWRGGGSRDGCLSGKKADKGIGIGLPMRGVGEKHWYGGATLHGRLNKSKLKGDHAKKTCTPTPELDSTRRLLEEPLHKAVRSLPRQERKY